MQTCRIEHVHKLILVFRRHVNQIWNTPQIGNVKESVVRRTVIPRKTSPIHTEHDRQVLKTHVVDNLVVCPLQEGRVDCAEGFKPFGCHSRRKKHRVLFRDTNVEISVQMFRLEPIKARTIRHRTRDRHDSGIVVCHFGKVISKDLAVGGLAERLGLARFGIIRSKTVKLFLLRQSRFIPFPLGRNHMEDHGEILGFQKLEHLDQIRNIVPIHRSVVGHSQLLENHAWENHPLHMLFSSPSHFQGLGSTNLFNKVCSSFVEMNETRIGCDLV